LNGGYAAVAILVLLDMREWDWIEQKATIGGKGKSG
jgi:hypothetical protein